MGSLEYQEGNRSVSWEQLLIWTRTLLRIERKMFFKNPRDALTKRGVGPPVVNVYAKGSRNVTGNNASNDCTGMDTMDPWEPTLSIQRSAKEYMAAVIVTLS